MGRYIECKTCINRNNGPFSLVFGAEEALNNAYHLTQNATTKLVDNVANYSSAIIDRVTMINFSSLTSYQSNHRYYDAPIDGDFSPIDGVTVINDYGNDWNNVKVVTQEFKFTSPASSASAFQWTAGTYLFYQNSPDKQATHFGEDAELIGVPDKNFSVTNTNKGRRQASCILRAGQLCYSKIMGIIGGLRFDYEQKK